MPKNYYCVHRTAAGERRKALQKAARREAQRLQREADQALAEAEALKLPGRLEDLTGVYKILKK
jgi:hypothetical protein